MIDVSAFHDYDIRGIYKTQIDEEFYYTLGRAFADYVRAGPITVGRDMRLSSPSLAASLIRGITDQGVDVVDLGMISTEMFYFSSGKYDFSAGVVVSASHNPPEYNGAKMVLKGVVALHGSFGLFEIRELMLKSKFGKVDRKGVVSKQDIFDDWIAHALTFITKDKIKDLKVVVDGGNGMGGPAWKEVEKQLPQVKIIPLYLDPDGSFPNHPADPLKDENLIDLKEKVGEVSADLGIALDGDADRIFFIDEQGARLSGTVTTAILAEYFLKDKPAAVLYNAICGRVVRETVEKYGGTPVRTRVGHSLIKEKMREVDGVFGGEHSGHFYFGENYAADSSLIAGLLMLQILSKSNSKMSQIRRTFDIYPQSGELNFRAKGIPTIISKIKESCRNAESRDELDGLSVWYADYWFNIRASKTEPLLRLNIEADDETILGKVKLKLLRDLQSYGARQK